MESEEERKKRERREKEARLRERRRQKILCASESRLGVITGVQPHIQQKTNPSNISSSPPRTRCGENNLRIGSIEGERAVAHSGDARDGDTLVRQQPEISESKRTEDHTVDTAHSQTQQTQADVNGPDGEGRNEKEEEETHSSYTGTLTFEDDVDLPLPSSLHGTEMDEDPSLATLKAAALPMPTKLKHLSILALAAILAFIHFSVSTGNSTMVALFGSGSDAYFDVTRSSLVWPFCSLELAFHLLFYVQDKAKSVVSTYLDHLCTQSGLLNLISIISISL